MIFFKKGTEKDLKGKWFQYHKIDNMRGNIFFIRGNIRIQITTERKIYFYLIDKITFLPDLENVMYNFINCSSLMFGSRVKYGIAFKAGQPGFEIFTRSNYHNFKVCVDSNSFEGAVGSALNIHNSYAMAEGLNVGIYDIDTF